MENAEARRVRLRALRDEADAHQSQSPSAPLSSTTKLVNPFDNNSPPPTDAQTPHFNYYSDPVAGFTNSKRKERGISGPASSVSPYPHQTMATGNNWQSEFHPPRGHRPPYSPQAGAFGSPIPAFDPNRQNFGAAPPAPACSYQPPAPPMEGHSEGGWQQQEHQQEHQRGGGRGRQGFGNFSHRGQGRGSPWRGDSNRGGGRGGRGPKFQRKGEGGISARDRPDLFYNKSMVEDPWRNLKN